MPLTAPSVVTLYKVKTDSKCTTAKGISQPGMAEHVKLLIREAKRQVALTLVCPDNLTSSVVSAAEFHLYCNAGEEKSVAAAKIFMAQAYLLTANHADDEKLIKR